MVKKSHGREVSEYGCEKYALTAPNTAPILCVPADPGSVLGRSGEGAISGGKEELFCVLWRTLGRRTAEAIRYVSGKAQACMATVQAVPIFKNLTCRP